VDQVPDKPRSVRPEWKVESHLAAAGIPEDTPTLQDRAPRMYLITIERSGVERNAIGIQSEVQDADRKAFEKPQFGKMRDPDSTEKRSGRNYLQRPVSLCNCF
jgi:hypothetical protein